MSTQEKKTIKLELSFKKAVFLANTLGAITIAFMDSETFFKFVKLKTKLDAAGARYNELNENIVKTSGVKLEPDNTIKPKNVDPEAISRLNEAYKKLEDDDSGILEQQCKFLSDKEFELLRKENPKLSGDQLIILLLCLETKKEA